MHERVTRCDAGGSKMLRGGAMSLLWGFSSSAEEVGLVLATGYAEIIRRTFVDNRMFLDSPFPCVTGSA